MKFLPGKRRVDWKNVMEHWAVRYALPLVLFAVTVLPAILLSNNGIKINFTIPVVLALLLTAWYGGRGPGLVISVLFQATTIIYATLPPDSTPAKAWFGYFSTFSLYVFLVYLIGGLRRTQQRLAEQRDLLQTTLASIGDGVITTDMSGKVTFMNPVAEHLTGWRGSAAQGISLENVFTIVSEETGSPVEHPVAKVLTTGSGVGLSNHTVLRSRSGREIPIDESAAPIRDREKVKGVVLVFSDVSERKAAERARRESEIMHSIVEAQEGERHRIARDLHDQLGQKMTALRLNIESLSDRCSRDSGIGQAVSAVQAAASDIDNDIGFLSWELRPTELDELGLVDALRSFLREWSRQYGIEAEFHASGSAGPDRAIRMDHSVETNIYRIVQEALTNIVKHAEAKKVSVLLQYRDERVVVIVEDDGRGFERRGENADAKRPGSHGLIGMRERAAILNGTLEVDTRPGGGTTILVNVPLSRDLSR